MGIFGDSGEIHKYLMGGKAVLCSHCGSDAFHSTKSQLHTKGLTFFQLEWLGQNVFALVCDNCSHIEWFAREPDQRPGS